MGMGWLSSGIAFLIGSPIAGALLAVDTGSGTEAEQDNFLAAQLWSGLLLFLGAASLCVLWRLLVKRARSEGESIWI